MLDMWVRAVLLLMLVWLIAEHYQQWGKMRGSQPVRYRRTGKKRTAKPKGEFQGVTRKPICAECEAAEGQSQVEQEPPPQLNSSKGRRKTVKTDLQYCPNERCRYYGWLGRGNIRSNGYPNRGRHRQLHCTVCRKYFVESTGTLFYGKRYQPEQMAQILTALAEGLGIRAVGRVFWVEPETVLAWLSEAGAQLEAFHRYQSRQLEVAQVQLDELYGVIRAYQTGELNEAEALAALEQSRTSTWLWTAIDPRSKFWLAAVVGERTANNAWKIVHQVVGQLKPGRVPLFLTDGNRAYEQPLLSHYGAWQPPLEGQRQPRWQALPELLYAQVVKKRRGRRLVSVSKRVVFGTLEQIQTRLASSGKQINTAYVERLNLTIRQLVPGLGRRVNTLAHTPDSLARQVSLVQTYYNFCLPCRSLDSAATGVRQRTPAMAVGITDRVWTLQAVLAFRPPPFPQVS